MKEDGELVVVERMPRGSANPGGIGSGQSGSQGCTGDDEAEGSGLYDEVRLKYEGWLMPCVRRAGPLKAVVLGCLSIVPRRRTKVQGEIRLFCHGIISEPVLTEQDVFIQMSCPRLLHLYCFLCASIIGDR